MISKRELLAWLDTDAYLSVGNYDPEGVAEGNAFLERVKEAERRSKGM